jgi:hypothetical protein
METAARVNEIAKLIANFDPGTDLFADPNCYYAPHPWGRYLQPAVNQILPIGNPSAIIIRARV